MNDIRIKMTYIMQISMHNMQIAAGFVMLLGNQVFLFYHKYEINKHFLFLYDNNFPSIKWSKYSK